MENSNLKAQIVEFLQQYSRSSIGGISKYLHRSWRLVEKVMLQLEKEGVIFREQFAMSTYWSVKS